MDVGLFYIIYLYKNKKTQKPFDWLPRNFAYMYFLHRKVLYTICVFMTITIDLQDPKKPVRWF